MREARREGLMGCHLQNRSRIGSSMGLESRWGCPGLTSAGFVGVGGDERRGCSWVWMSLRDDKNLLNVDGADGFTALGIYQGH